MSAADYITIFRIALSPLILWLPPFSCRFMVVYLLCGISDVADGFLARRLHTESERGARLDSAADLLFAAVCFARILPTWKFPIWLWSWIGMIALVRVMTMAGCICSHREVIRHSMLNKATGGLLFLLPLLPLDICYSAIPVCVLASVAALQEGKCLLHGRA